jgi:hypothetical protein
VYDLGEIVHYAIQIKLCKPRQNGQRDELNDVCIVRYVSHYESELFLFKMMAKYLKKKGIEIDKCT